MKWSISRISRQCNPCEKNFNDGEEVFSTVVMRENSEDSLIETERFDICASCWEKWEDKANPFWKCAFREKEEDETNKLPDKDTVMNLFLQKMKTETTDLEEEEKKEIEVLRYLLALMLERKKRLILCESKKQEWSDRIIYRDAKSEDLFQLGIPEMSDEDIRIFQEKLKALLPVHNAQKKPEPKIEEPPPGS